MAAKKLLPDLHAKNVREWLAFFGGEELGISVEHASAVWNSATKAVEKRFTSHNKPSHRPICRWKYVEDGYWHTSCGKDWCFPEGSPVENGVKFCPLCGKQAYICQTLV